MDNEKFNDIRWERVGYHVVTKIDETSECLNQVKRDVQKIKENVGVLKSLVENLQRRNKMLWGALIALIIASMGMLGTLISMIEK